MARTLGSQQYLRPGWAAFGLIGLLVVLAIVLYLLFGQGGTGTSYMEQAAKTRERGREVSVQVNTRSLVQSIVAHQTTTGELPESVEELGSPRAFTDPWGNRMWFEYEDERARPVVVIIRSPGPDGREGTDDDVEERERLPL